MNAIIALNPQQMQEAQTTTIGWVDAKLADAKQELVTAEQVYNALEKHKLRTVPASSQIRRARNRIAFYEKVKAALDAGYYIIPPFNVQLFALRTNRTLPSAENGERNYERDVSVPALPVGKGDYVDPSPNRYKVSEIQKKNYSGDGMHTVAIYENAEWRGVDLPERAMKPQLIEATGKALALKIFDALGIAPAYRSADPIIVGHIRRPQGRGVLTFFVAWWLDQSDL